MRRIICLSLLLAACATGDLASPPRTPAPASAASVIATERAFAARAGEIAWVPAFREFVAPDGQLAEPAGLVDAVERLNAARDDGNRNLFWWPAYAGIARSDDLGFTTGPVSFDASREAQGHYFTVWRRQPDGAWRWIFDGGVGPIDEAELISPAAVDVPTLPVADAGAGSASLAAAQVSALEHSNDAAALVARLAEDAQVFRTRRPRATGASASAAMAIPSADISYRLLRAEASLAGDLVMTLGAARWDGEDGAAQGLYARIWQLRAGEWQIVYDQLALPPPAPRADSNSPHLSPVP